MAGRALNPLDNDFATATKPAFPTNSEAQRKWFRNCSSPAAKDGTQWYAEDINLLLFLVRHSLDAYGISDDPPRESLLTELLQAQQGIQSDGLPLHIRLSNAGQTLQDVPTNVDTVCTNLVSVAGNFPAGAWTGTRLNITAETQGVFGIYNRLNINQESGEGAKTFINGAEVDSYQMSPTAGSGNVVGFTHFHELYDGDYVEFVHHHKTGSTKTNSASYAAVYRLSKIF